MTPADHEREQKIMEDIARHMEEEQRNPTALAPPPRKKRVQKKELTPVWQEYIDTIWRPEQQARIDDASSRNALEEVEDVIREGIDLDALDFSGDVSIYRAEAFFKWLTINQPHDHGDRSRAHWPTRWTEVVGHLIDEHQARLLKAQGISQRNMSKAFNAMLDGRLTQEHLDAIQPKLPRGKKGQAAASGSGSGKGAAGPSSSSIGASSRSGAKTQTTKRKRSSRKE